MRKTTVPLLVLLLGVMCPGAFAEEQTRIDFDRDIRPILADTCFHCHGPDRAQRKADLRLDTREGAFADLGESRAIVPGKPDESELIHRITASEEYERMPPADSGRSLSQKQIELLTRWVADGAEWSHHWSFVPPERPALPPPPKHGEVHNAIDRFVLARLEEEGLKPAPAAAKEKLIRRVTFDLTGLPPTPQEIDAFLADDSPDAYEKVVDRLLASPRYGERMAMPWLDAARYADTNGYQTDGTRPMWPWRDWLIDALNANMPFDQFTLEQIAGDMLPEPSLDQLIATGFNRNHMLNGEGGRIAEESRVEYVVDRVETTTAVWLGLTAGCGRCHDHKYDPLTQEEFYGLYAYFNNVDETGAVDRSSSTAAPTIRLPTDGQKAKQAELESRIRRLEEQVNELKKDEAAGTKADLESLEKQLADTRRTLDKHKKSYLITMIMRERAKPRQTHLLLRGQYNKYGEKVSARVPDILHPLPEGAPNNRLGLARWLVDWENPLVARVTVNRFWQLFFGTGLVRTTEDFGTQGERPTHPRLLDWLATEFMRDWNIKRMHRLIVTSATYRQSAKAAPELIARDPENRLLARGPRHRLSSFALRDQALALSGLLVEKQGGPPVQPYQPEGIWKDFSFGKIVYKQDHGEKLYRRSLYTFWRRSVGPTTMFDTSPRQVCELRPRRTNTPLHALTLLNDPTFGEAARRVARRMIIEGGGAPAERLRWGFRAATARYPTPEEEQILAASLARLLKQYREQPSAAEELITVGEAPRDASLDPIEHAAYTGVASLILNLDEVLNK